MFPFQSLYLHISWSNLCECAYIVSTYTLVFFPSFCSIKVKNRLLLARKCTYLFIKQCYNWIKTNQGKKMQFKVWISNQMFSLSNRFRRCHRGFWKNERGTDSFADIFQLANRCTSWSQPNCRKRLLCNGQWTWSTMPLVWFKNKWMGLWRSGWYFFMKIE